MNLHSPDNLNTLADIPAVPKRILFANVPLDGHFGPLTGLAVHLKQLGHDVRWYSSVNYEKKIRSLGIPVFPFRRALDVSRADLEEVFPGREKHKGKVAKLKFDIINVFVLRGEEYYEDIREVRQLFPFDLLIADCAFSAIPFVTDKMKIPVISIGVFPLMETSRDLAPYGLAQTPATGTFGKWKQAFQRRLADKFIFGKPNRVTNGIMKKHGIDTNGANLFDLLIRKASLVLQSGTPGFEYKRSDLSSNVRFIGPLLPYSKRAGTAKWYHPKMEEYSNIILVTQGTVEKDPAKILIPTLEAFKNSSYLVIATTGYAQTNELRDKYPYDNIIIEDFIPFADVMPYASVYVTNGGYGGVMLGIQHKLPMVVAGIHEGKNEINARVSYFKLGIDLKTEFPTPEQIRKSVTTVCTDNTYRHQIGLLSAEFDRYDPFALCADYVSQIPSPSHVSAIQQ